MTLTPEQRINLVSRIENLMRHMSLLSGDLSDGPTTICKAHPAYYAINRALNSLAEAREMLSEGPELPPRPQSPPE